MNRPKIKKEKQRKEERKKERQFLFCMLKYK